jgi:hypothetical protein
MRESVKITDYHYLFICNSDKLDTLARRCLSDVLFFRNTGAEVSVICQSDTPLFEQFKAEGINLYSLNSFSSQWNRVIVLLQLLKKISNLKPFDFVHCYHYELLFTLGIFLKRISPISLVFTCNQDVSTLYRFWWHDFFIKRIDYVFTLSPSIQEQLADLLPIPSRKVSVMGLGLESQISFSPRKKDSDEWNLCVFVANKFDLDEGLELLLRILDHLNENLKSNSPNIKLKLNLLSEVVWEKHFAFQSLKSLVLERGLSSMVEFKYRPQRNNFFLGQDIFISIDDQELFNDIELWALLSHLPIVIPRTSVREQLLQSRELGHTYQMGDGRELKQKILFIIDHYFTLLSSLEMAVPKLHESHQFEHYSILLRETYQKLIARRARLVSLKNKMSS